MQPYVNHVKKKQKQKQPHVKKSERGAKHMFVRTLPFLGSWVWLFPVLLWHSQTQLVYTDDRNTSPSGLEMVKTSALDS